MTVKTFTKNVVHPAYINMSAVTGFRREGSQLMIHDGGVQPIVVSFKTLEAAIEAEAEFQKDLIDQLAAKDKPAEEKPAEVKPE